MIVFLTPRRIPYQERLLTSERKLKRGDAKGGLIMAHKESIQSSLLSTFLEGEPYFWTVSTHVGYGYKNKSEDVRLVQYFLNIAFRDAKHGPKKLVTDGLFGGKTWRAIRTFQEDYSFECIVDGMISPANGISTATPKQGMVYTIYHLNYAYRSKKKEHFRDLRTDPELPGELRSYLSAPMPDLL
jgi:hypothetical protein